MFALLKSEIHHLEANKKNLRSFGLTVGGVFLLVAAYIWWHNAFNFTPFSAVIGILGTLLMFLGAIIPQMLRKVYMIWMGIAIVMGFLMTNLILSVFYFVLITPIGLFRRMIGKDDLNRKKVKKALTYWRDKTYHDASKKRLERYF